MCAMFLVFFSVFFEGAMFFFTPNFLSFMPLRFLNVYPKIRIVFIYLPEHFIIFTFLPTYLPTVHRKKKVREFPVPSRDVTTKLSLSGNNDVVTELFLPRGSLVSDIPAGDGKLVNLFLRCTYLLCPFS